MNSRNIENVVHDEANDLTYVVMAKRTLTDGELFSAIRVALLHRGGKSLEKGEKLIINSQY